LKVSFSFFKNNLLSSTRSDASTQSDEINLNRAKARADAGKIIAQIFN